jgi:hypothetical protein
MEDKIFDIVTDLLRKDITKEQAIDKLVELYQNKINMLEQFKEEMGEDYILWDESEKGKYPIKRTFNALKNLIDRIKDE